MTEKIFPDFMAGEQLIHDMPISQKYKRFVRRYCVHLNSARACREIGISAATGSKLLKRPEIQRAIEEYQFKLAEADHVTKNELTTYMREAVDLALEEGQASAVTSAALGIAKLHGLITDKSQVETKGAMKITVGYKEPPTQSKTIEHNDN